MITELSCIHRKWFVAGSDTITSEYNESIALNKDYVIDHKCDELTVYRKKFGLKRTFYQKFNEVIIPDEELEEDTPDTFIREV